MKKLLFLFMVLVMFGCNNPKTVLICGDHVCVNKAEAEQYFEENLTLEVKVINNKKSKEVNLVEINLESSPEGKKAVSVIKKKQTSKKLKDLSNLEIKEKKAEIRKKKKIKNEEIKNTKIAKQTKLKEIKKKEKTQVSIIKTKEVVNKRTKKITDICSILEKCSIDEISKYLVKQGKKKKFPDITTRENE